MCCNQIKDALCSDAQPLNLLYLTMNSSKLTLSFLGIKFGFSSPVHWPQSHIMFQTQKGSRRFKRIENRNGVFALLVSFMGH